MESAELQSVIHREHPAVKSLPANVTFHDLIRSNKRKSAMLMISMVAILGVLGALIAAAIVAYGGADAEILIPSAIAGCVAALVVGVIAALWSFYGGSSAILRIANAHELDRNADPQLYNVVEELSIAAGIPMPKVYVIPDDALNAFATGRDPEHGAVAITTALRQQLSRDELAGVIAHELSHIRHFDIRFAMLMATMVGLIVFACDAYLRMLRHGMLFGGSSRRSSSSGKGGNPIAIILIVLALVFALVAPFLAMMIRFAVSRQREYLADAGAIELTRYPQGLIGALEKLGSSKAPLDRANRATAHLYMVDPMKHPLSKKGHEANSVFRTHPPLHDRIARLQALLH